MIVPFHKPFLVGDEESYISKVIKNEHFKRDRQKTTLYCIKLQQSNSGWSTRTRSTERFFSLVNNSTLHRIRASIFHSTLHSMSASAKIPKDVLVLGIGNPLLDVCVDQPTDALLKKYDLQPEYTSKKEFLIGLYFNPESPYRQEVISVKPYECSPVIDLDPALMKETARFCLLFDVDILTHFLGILTEKNKEVVDKMSKTTLLPFKVFVGRGLCRMIQIMGEEYIEFLSKHNLLHSVFEYFTS